MDELDALAAQAAGIDQEVASAAPGAVLQQQEAEAVMDLAQQNTIGVGMILDTALPILGKLYPSLQEIYTPEVCYKIAASLGPVLAKYNISMASWGAVYKEEIGAAFVCVPIAWATYQGIKADILARATPQAVKVEQAAA